MLRFRCRHLFQSLGHYVSRRASLPPQQQPKHYTQKAKHHTVFHGNSKAALNKEQCSNASGHVIAVFCPNIDLRHQQENQHLLSTFTKRISSNVRPLFLPSKRTTWTRHIDALALPNIATKRTYIAIAKPATSLNCFSGYTILRLAEHRTSCRRWHMETMCRAFTPLLPCTKASKIAPAEPAPASTPMKIRSRFFHAPTMRIACIPQRMARTLVSAKMLELRIHGATCARIPQRMARTLVSATMLEVRIHGATCAIHTNRTGS